ncbi:MULTISPECIES: hypothetical protein [unclassified Methylobacterium]|jgi:hypothetical protein|uniref:hypothetical protein n=1 Tax=unclassified Methylobacterium TaxID=2615210 RepID=UPI0011C1EFE6|nr:MULTISPECIES: hypothetical protein [unclassified Methylobacterium]RZK98097.1 MAG: hypothetical protein EOO66_01275 [Methylobacterium sp.]TXM73819.1 hypothetical protein FV226_08410 [Methylobacterium sp. WL12]MCJ2020930.1 hypothetical protein [Methylobacterium sp. E-065]MCJ2041554.1 hypothetical protein [Methylobacterium sp. J-059]MCJ2130369.1 hypothetical protein [Methylobacterium sp. E-045]
MHWLGTVLRELLGLVVDDVGFAASIVAWVGAAWLVRAYGQAGTTSAAIFLFGGLGLILVESVLRRSGAPR